VRKQGSAAGPSIIYQASKTLAEHAAWNFVASHKELPRGLVVIDPSSHIFGVLNGKLPMCRVENVI